MLVNTTVFGDYEGPEEVLQKDPLFTKINVLENYAPVKKVTAFVTDVNGNPVDSAIVEFQLYNYAEFYPLFKTFTGKDGCCSFKTGLGDLIVWASGKGNYGFAKLDVRQSDTIEIKLNQDEKNEYSLDFDLVPPVEQEITVKVTDSAKKLNSDRIAFEDKIRNAYEATFIDSSKSIRLAALVHLNGDTLWSFLRKSRGNWRELTDFISGTPSGQQHLIFPLLKSLSEKDLRDVDPMVLEDAISNIENDHSEAKNPDDFIRYVISPRVDNEYLKPWRKLFLTSFEPGFIVKAKEDPGIIADWIRSNITLDKIHNYSRAPITPVGVYELKAADEHSAGILFVAICRSFGIPARLDPATKVPQYLFSGNWKEVRLFEPKQPEGNKGFLTLLNQPENEKKPEYSTHYSIGSYQDGFFRTLDYEASPLVQDFPCSIEVPAGRCLMITGSRLTNGTVLAKVKCFEVKTGEKPSQTIELRKREMPVAEYGQINPDLWKKTGKKETIIAWVEPGKEPTKHLLADIRQKKREFGSWNGSFTMVFQTADQMKTFVNQEAATLPAGIAYSLQSTFPIRISDLKVDPAAMQNLPVVVFVTKDGMVRYLSEGYRIGIGDELLSLMK